MGDLEGRREANVRYLVLAHRHDATLTSYVHTYNHLIAQRALDHRSPVQALRQWRSDKPELFRKRVNDLPGLDT